MPLPTKKWLRSAERGSNNLYILEYVALSNLSKNEILLCKWGVLIKIAEVNFFTLLVIFWTLFSNHIYVLFGEIMNISKILVFLVLFRF